MKKNLLLLFLLSCSYWVLAGSTLAKKKALPGFEEFPWLVDLINTGDCCHNNKVSVYSSSIYQFVFIEGKQNCSNNKGTLYFQDGTYYCSDSPGLDCRLAYGLKDSDLIKSWKCDSPPTLPEEDLTNLFSSFPWLADLIDTQDCSENSKITAYYNSIYTFLFVEKKGNTEPELYFQDGTFYCKDTGGLDCRTAYHLTQERSSLLWECGTVAPPESNNVSTIDTLVQMEPQGPFNYLALGDSYTIGARVPSTQNYPNQLVARLSADGININPADIIARTGWTTGNLQNAINQEQPPTTYDMVSLLIGVNNQFRGRSQQEYAREFESLLQQAIQFAKGVKDKVFVLSIPDYGYTPYGERSDASRISEEIDAFNEINKRITEEYNILYFDITPISRKGLAEPILVAADGLHPSGEQYSRWVAAIYSEIKTKILSK